MEEDLDLSENIARQLVAVSRAGSIVALDCTEAPPEIYLWPDEDEAIAKLHGFSSEEAIAFVSRALEGEGLVEYLSSTQRTARCAIMLSTAARPMTPTPAHAGT